MSVVSNALLDAIALAEAAKEAGITESQARRFAAALGEMSADRATRIIGSAAEQLRCGRIRQARRAGR